MGVRSRFVLVLAITGGLGMEKKQVGGQVVRSRSSKEIAMARKELVESLPDVARKLVTDAKTGSIPHMKLLLHLLGLEDGGLTPKQRARREKTLEEIVMEQFRKEP